MKKRINVRGELNALQVKGILSLPKGQCRPSTVRYAAAVLKVDTGKSFSVSATVDSKVITVTRIS